MSEINYFKIESCDKTKPIYRITLGDLIPEEKRQTHPTKNLYENLTGSKGFIDYAVVDHTLEIILVGIEPEYKSNGCKQALFKEAGSYAKTNKLKEVIYYNEKIYTKKELKKLK